MKLNSNITYTPRLFKKLFSNYRKGKFDSNENEYIDLLIKVFLEGIIDIPLNYPMRIFLANCIGRNPMCISKKYRGLKSIRKKRYVLKKISNQSPDFIQKANDFKNIQQKFLKSLNKYDSVFVPSILGKSNTKSIIIKSIDSEFENLFAEDFDINYDFSKILIDFDI